MSEILRIYLEKRYGILAVESTTLEILRDFKNQNIEIDLKAKEELKEVLESCDLAKFAKWIPEPTEIIHLNKESKGIVEETKAPKVSPEEVPSGV